MIAGGDIHVQATGAQDSDLNIIGSRLSAGQGIRLQADDNILLRAAENTATQSSRDSGGGWSVGVGFGLGAAHKTASHWIWLPTNSVANRMAATACGATPWLKPGNRCTWILERTPACRAQWSRANRSPQRLAAICCWKVCKTPVLISPKTAAPVQASACAFRRFCAGTSTASASQNSGKARSDYASVNQQTGIQAGDGGFQLKVKGRTDLTGAVIASSEQAVQDGLNRLETGTLVARDVENYSKYKASSSGLVASVGFGIGQENKATATTDQDNSYRPDLTGSAVSKISGRDSGVTRSGISQAEIVITDWQAQQELTGQTAMALLDKLNDAVRSGDSSGGIAKLGWQAT